MNPSISLIVLRTSQIDKSISFYAEIGLSFTKEQHGKGPVHYSSSFAQTVLEIYPGKEAEILDRKCSGATMLGFSVSSVDDVFSKLKSLSFQVVSEISQNEWGKRAVFLDPDGRAIEISEK